MNPIPQIVGFASFRCRCHISMSVNCDIKTKTEKHQNDSREMIYFSDLLFRPVHQFTNIANKYCNRNEPTRTAAPCKSEHGKRHSFNGSVERLKSIRSPAITTGQYYRIRRHKSNHHELEQRQQRQQQNNPLNVNPIAAATIPEATLANRGAFDIVCQLANEWNEIYVPVNVLSSI